MGRVSEYFESKKHTLKNDLIAGLIVAIVALPLAIGFAIASNVPPAMGIITAVVAGFFASLFGGSEYQISGPTGAMVVVILSVVNKYGVDGLIIATFVAGVILLLLGIFKFGKIIEYIPSPVIVGFTAGIATIIFFGQLNNFLGINPTYPAGAEFLEKTIISFENITHANIAGVILAILTILILVLTPKINKKIPGSIVAVTITTILTVIFSSYFKVKTVGDIGKLPSMLPMPHLPQLTVDIIIAVLPAAITIAALAAIESLLSAVVADSLTDTKHKPNKELVGQGIANIASSLFGGMPATGAIARTATNIRNGGKTRLTGIIHAIFLLALVLFLGSLAVLIPLPTIAGILMFVAFNMVEWERIFLILKTPMSDVAVMASTFFVTILVDLTTAIEVGIVLASILFMKRMSDLYKVEEIEGSPEKNGHHKMITEFNNKNISVYTMYGPLFFGAASRFEQAVADTPGGRKPIKIIRMKHVPVIDATGINFLEGTAKKHRRMKNGVVLLSTVHPDVMKVLQKTGVDKIIGEEHIFPSTKAAVYHALKHSHRINGEPERVTEEEMKDYKLEDIEKDDTTITSETRDKDPIEEMIEGIGIHKIPGEGVKIIKKTGRHGARIIRTTGKHGARIIKTTGKHSARIMKKVNVKKVRLPDVKLPLMKKRKL